MATTFDPAHTAATMALSGGNLIATSSGGSNTVNGVTLGTTAMAGKQYFEVTLTGTMGQYFTVGVMNGSASLTANLGQSNGAGMMNKGSGSLNSIYINGLNNVGGTDYPVYVSGQVVRVAVDRTANKIWWAVNNNTWSGSAVWMGSGNTTDNPATGAGGASLISVTAPIYPAVSSSWTGDVATAAFGSAGFAYAVPAGFAGIDPPATGGSVTQAMALILA